MKVLLIHTYYKYKGGEDAVVEKEKHLLEQNGCIAKEVSFYNTGNTGLKFLLAPFNPFSFYRIFKILHKFKPDIVHLHNWSFAASPSVVWAAKMKKIPVVHTLHNFRIICPSATLSFNQQLYLESLNSYFPWKGIRKGVYKSSVFSSFWQAVITRINYLLGTWNKIDLFIALTESSKKIFKASYLKIDASKIIIKPNFNDLVQFLSTSDRKDHFLYVGRLSEEKGIKTLLAAFENSAHSLRIIGDGPLKKEVKDFVVNNKNVTYLGYKNKEEIETEMSSCSAMLFPSICFETFGMTIIEAFGRGTPVISSNIGSPIDLIVNGFNGFHFNAGDATDLNRKMSQWQNSSQKEKESFYVHALESYKQFYTPEKNFSLLINIYSSLIHEKHKHQKLSYKPRSLQ